MPKYKILNLREAEFLKTFSHPDVPGFSYVWHEGLINVNYPNQPVVDIFIADEYTAKNAIIEALNHYRWRAFDQFPDMGWERINYQECEFELVEVENG